MAAAALTLGRIDQRWLLRVLLFLAVTVVAAAIDLTNTALGRALLPAFGSTLGVGGGMAARILIGVVLGILALLNLLLLKLLPFVWQVLLMWVELLLLFLAFFRQLRLVLHLYLVAADLPDPGGGHHRLRLPSVDLLRLRAGAHGRAGTAVAEWSGLRHRHLPYFVLPRHTLVAAGLSHLSRPAADRIDAAGHSLGRESRCR
jgi:hypothetical protein